MIEVVRPLDPEGLSRRSAIFRIDRPYSYIGRGRAYRVYVDGDPRQPLLVNFSSEQFPVEPGRRLLAVGHGSGRLVGVRVDVADGQQIDFDLQVLSARTVFNRGVSVRLSRRDNGEEGVDFGAAPQIGRILKHDGPDRGIERLVRRALNGGAKTHRPD